MSAQVAWEAQRASHAPRRVLIAGGGVGAVEAALALRALAGDRVEIQLLSPERYFWYRPLAVLEPFGLGQIHGVELSDVADACGAELRLASLSRVDSEAHLAYDSTGTQLEYDYCVLATGAIALERVAGAITYGGPADRERLERLLAEVESGSVRRVVFALPGGVTWPLPLYELALLTDTFRHTHSFPGVELALVTPEERPLMLFGHAASEAVANLLAEREIELYTARYPARFTEGALETVPGPAIPADAVVALPGLAGAPIDGIPRDADGFVPVDDHGRVRGIDDVYAAGDCCVFPIKQGGLAAQQADAAAEAIAASAGAGNEPQPFRPVLRGLLLTGSISRYLRSDLTIRSSTAADAALWWPPAKIVGRYLAPFLAERADTVISPPADS